MADEQKKIEEGEEEEKRNIIPSYASRSGVEWSSRGDVLRLRGTDHMWDRQIYALQYYLSGLTVDILCNTQEYDMLMLHYFWTRVINHRLKSRGQTVRVAKMALRPLNATRRRTSIQTRS